jgi:hypothetical protein
MAVLEQNGFRTGIVIACPMQTGELLASPRRIDDIVVRLTHSIECRVDPPELICYPKRISSPTEAGEFRGR